MFIVVPIIRLNKQNVYGKRKKKLFMNVYTLSIIWEKTRENMNSIYMYSK